uniref:2,3-bisphosphoglycerate-independent phosphoglycerate mutase n=1 Tax=Antithamnionella ternifolia TaxID=207919 RepID=A0A4D6WK58_9FLOR|nr:Phosphoglycerate mutase [Antithamnionella ternifolia]
MNNKSISPIILMILDGWGHSNTIKGNAIQLANTPTIDKLWDSYPNTLLNASGEDVGLPHQQMGNSEVGHTTIGAGRIINQDLVKISKSITNKDFFNKNKLHNIYKYSFKQKSKVHIIGLCSNGGVHSHINHLKALIQISKQYKVRTCLHLITDGRDTLPKQAKLFIQEIIDTIINSDNIEICTISGRYYSMDRDCRWSRTEKAYKAMVEHSYNIDYSKNILSIIDQYYDQNISDEFLPPTKTSTSSIIDNDSLIFFNFRPDRIRQLLHSFAKPHFKGFQKKDLKNLMLTTFTEYDSTLSIPIVFPNELKKNFLGQIISNRGLKQLRLAETEKYAHVTYFFNGGIEEPFPGENRELIPSPKVETYDLAPEMSAYQLTNSLIDAINKQLYQFIVINYANPDMIGHTGKMDSTVEAIEIVDQCIQNVLKTVEDTNSILIITADHGNADYMVTEHDKPCTSHSLNPVPFILVSNSHVNKTQLHSNGSLADIAPTILDILDIDIPNEMNGKSLII